MNALQLFGNTEYEAMKLFQIFLPPINIKHLIREWNFPSICSMHSLFGVEIYRGGYLALSRGKLRQTRCTIRPEHVTKASDYISWHNRAERKKKYLDCNRTKKRWIVSRISLWWMQSESICHNFHFHLGAWNWMQLKANPICPRPHCRVSPCSSSGREEAKIDRARKNLRF